MRVATWSLPLVAGCQLVYPLDPDATELRRPSFNARRTGGPSLEVTLPPHVVAGDLVIGTLQSSSFSNELVDRPLEWELLDEFADEVCVNVAWHVWFVRLRVDDDRTFSFGFGEADDISGLFVPYVDVVGVEYVRSLIAIDTPDGSELVFPGGSTTPGAILHLSTFGNEQTSEDPAGMDRIAAFEHIVAFDRTVADGQIPPITVPVPPGLCLGAAQIDLTR